MTETTLETGSAGGGAGRCPRWVRIALVLSLAFNLLLVGLIGGSVLAYRKWGMRPPAGDIVIGAMTDALSRDDRRALRRAFLAERAGFEDRRDRIEDDTEDLVEALREEPWDEGKVTEIFARQQARTSDGLEAGQSLLLDRFRSMGTAERRAYADRLEELLSHMQGEHRRERNGDHDD